MDHECGGQPAEDASRQRPARVLNEMATVKLATLVIRTLAKPIANSIKQQARTREPFRKLCVSFAQTIHRAEVHLRYSLLGQPQKAVRPLNETAAIESGANTLAEGFLFSVAAALVIGESWRSSRNDKNRRVSVNDQLEELSGKVDELRMDLHSVVNVWEEKWMEERQRSEDLTRIVETLVNIGMRNGIGALGTVQLTRSSSSLTSVPSEPSSTSTSRASGSNSIPADID